MIVIHLQNMKKALLLSFYLCLLSGVSFAQTDSTSSITVTGYIDCYYAYNFTEPTSNNIPFAYNHNRHNEFNVNNVVVGLKYSNRRLRSNLLLHAGTYVKANYAAEPTLLQFINEASVGVKLSKKIWLDAGIMPSHIGMETAISKDNWTLTRSLCAENSPYYETGAKLSFVPNSKLSLAFLVLNGWQNIEEKNSNKAVGTQVQFVPTKKWLINYSTFLGEGKNLPDSLQVLRHFHDVYFTWLISDKLAIASVFDFGYEQKSKTDKSFAGWYTPALLVRCKLTKQWNTCLRAEYFNDQNRIIGINNEVTGFSLNLDYAPMENALIRIEGKTFPTRDTQGNFAPDSFVNSTFSLSFALGF
jgi:hypothetical protein